MDKLFISPEQLLQDSFSLAIQAINSAYHPDLIVGIWRGGTPVGIAVHEAYSYAGLNCDHIAIRTSSYTGIAQRQGVTIEGLDHFIEKARLCSRLLLVDDVYDSGQTMAAIISAIEERCGKQQHKIKIAAPYFKAKRNTTSRKPDYFLHETDRWLVFPHELEGLTQAEVKRKPGMAELAEQLLSIRQSKL